MMPLLSILCLLLCPAVTQAYEWRTSAGTNALVVPAGEILAEEALLLGDRVDVQGAAERDLWLIAATTIQFDGDARGDLRALAGSAVFGGTTRQNLLAYGRGLHLTSNAVVQGQTALVGGTVICEGTMAGDAWIYARSVTLGGHWGGNVRVHASEIRVAPGTSFAGDLLYTSPRPLAYDSSVSIAGEARQIPARLPGTGALAPGAVRARFLFHGYLFLAALLVGMPFVGFFPQLAGGAVRRLRLSPWRVLLAGAILLLLGPLLIAFAFMTVVGIPLALLLAGLYAALAYLAHIVIALWLGHTLVRSPAPQTFARVLAALATGLFLIYFATALPGLAAFVVPPVLVLGGGALVLALLSRPFLPLPPPLPKPPEMSNQPQPGVKS